MTSQPASTSARPATSSRCWAGFHAGHRLGCTTADCACPCHTAPAPATPVVETPTGTAPDQCAALVSGHDVCPGECDGCHVHGRRNYDRTAASAVPEGSDA